MKKRIKILLLLIWFVSLFTAGSLLHARENLSVTAGTGCKNCVIETGFNGTETGLYLLTTEELDAVEAAGLYATPYSMDATDHGRIILWDETGDEQGGRAPVTGDLFIMK